jgi:GT2 family glycosyltransferase
LRRTLVSLSRYIGHAVPSETIIWMNGASPEVATVVHEEVSGAVVGASDVNLGFAGGNNRAAALARGHYLILLNDDAEVEPGWLENLVQTADSHPEAGAVGSRILFPDGRLQEAGSLLWADGSAYPVGRGLPGDSLRYGYLRRVDFSSASSLLVRRETWDRLGGLDEDFFPAYYEDIDLCMRIREQGQCVLLEPRSVVIHYESASTDSDFRHFLHLRNRRRFVRKWRAQLLDQEPADPTSPAAVERAVRRAQGWPERVLLIDDRLPESGIGSGFSRMVDFVNELSGAGFAISVYCTVSNDGDRDRLAGLGVEVLQEDLSVHLAQSHVFYEYVVVSRPHNFDRFAPLVRQLQPRTILIYDAEALYFRRLGLKLALTDDPEARARLEAETAAARDLEHRIAVEADHLVCLSHDEKTVLEAIPGHAPVELLEPIVPDIRATARSFSERRGMLFVPGWLAGPDSPNADGLIWFVCEVMPKVRARIPWVVLRVAGSDPPANVLELESPFVEFIGRVDDLSTAYGWARAVIAPIRYGAGVKLKVTEALQYGVPVVATTVAAEGLNTELRHCLLIADQPAAFARHVVRLLSSRDDWERTRARIVRLPSWQPERHGAWSAVLRRAHEARWAHLVASGASG